MSKQKFVDRIRAGLGFYQLADGGRAPVSPREIGADTKGPTRHTKNSLTKRLSKRGWMNITSVSGRKLIVIEK